MEHLKERTIRGGFAKLCAQATNFVLRVGFIAVLARLLSPEDFGVVGMVTTLTGLISVLSNAWLASGSVQQAEINERQLSNLFWIYFAFGVILCIACFVAAPVVAAFYNEPRLVAITRVLGIGCLFTTIGVQHYAILQRQLRYVAIATIEATSLSVSVAVGIAMALAGYGYWALVAVTIVLPACNTICLWTATRWIPGLPDHMADVRPMVRFGGLITLNIMIVYFAYNLDKVLIGRFWGAGALGIYGRAYQLATIPPEDINAGIGGVAFSALSRLQDDPARFKRFFLKGYALVISVTFPITILCGLYAPDIVGVLLGPKWGAAGETLRLLTPTVAVFGIINPLGWLMFSAGMAGRSTRIALVIAPLVSAAFMIGLPYGPNGVALAFSVAMLLWLVPHVIWCVRGTNVSPTDLLGAVMRPVLATGAAAVLAFGAQLYTVDFSPFLRLLIGGTVMVSAYVVILAFVLGQRDLYNDVLRGLTRPISLTP